MPTKRYNSRKSKKPSRSKEAIPWFKDVELLIVKVTNRCNINCEYCYETSGTDGRYVTMDLDLFRRVVHQVLKSAKAGVVRFVLHGGEPTLLSYSWLREALRHIVREGKRFNKGAIIGLQSNLVNVSERKLKLFKQFGVRLSGSLDDPLDPKHSARPMTDKTIKTLLKLRDMGIPSGIVLNITGENIDKMKRICRYFSDVLGIKYFTANIAYPVGSGEDMKVPSKEALFNAQKDILEFMMETEGKSLLEHNLCTEIARYFEHHLTKRKRRDHGCDAKMCGTAKYVLAVDPLGNILPCGRIQVNETEFILGSFRDYDTLSKGEIDQFFKKARHFRNLNKDVWKACKNCPARAICSFGCKAFVARAVTPVNIECKLALRRLDYYRKHEDEIRPIYEAYRGLDTTQ